MCELLMTEMALPTWVETLAGVLSEHLETTRAMFCTVRAGSEVSEWRLSFLPEEPDPEMCINVGAMVRLFDGVLPDIPVQALMDTGGVCLHGRHEGHLVMVSVRFGEATGRVN